MNKNLIKNIIKVVIAAVTLLFIYKSSVGYFQIIFDKINLDFLLISCLILLRFFQQIIASLRLFSLLKLISKYNSNFIEWCRLYFSTGLLYLTPLVGAGHIARAYEMKNRQFSYKEYINFQFIIFSWAMLIESFLIFLICIFYNEINVYITISFFIIMLCFLPLLSKNFINILLVLFKKIKVFRFLNKLKLNIERILEIAITSLKKKNFINYFFYTICLFCSELLLFYLILNNIFLINNLEVIFLIFILNFFIRKIPFINNIPGLKEAINGAFAYQFGLVFLEGVLFLVIFRVLNLLAILLNNFFFFLMKKSYF